jgi:hypothetical protein
MSHPAHHDEPARTAPDHLAHSHARADTKPAPQGLQVFRGSSLGWPAWLRVLLVLPLVALLWLGVWWAMAGVKPW